MKRKAKAAKEPSAAKDKAMENNQITLSEPSSLVLKKTASKYISSDVRRSGRLQKFVLPAGNKHVAKEVDLTDNKMEEGLHAEKINSHHSEELGGITELVLETDHDDGKGEEVELVEPINTDNPTEEQIGMEDKVDYLYQLANELKAKAAKRSTLPSGTSTCEDLNYKNLYIDSQKKVDALTEANFQLAKDLQFALGKIEAYEKKFNDPTGKLMEMFVLTKFERVAETVVNLSEDAQMKSYADKNPSSLQPKAAVPNLAQDANKKSGADTDAPNPTPQPKVALAIAPAATRNTKRKKTSK